MNRLINSCIKKIVLPAVLISLFSFVHAQSYHWKEPNATVVKTGNLLWNPKPFEFPAKKSDEIRYIDYENGDDNNDGRTKNTPWKHHPWDTRATANAANASGPATYVFKRGVIYRIFSEGEMSLLIAGESGSKENPIRLTSDPSWGKGEAVIAGSKSIEGDWKKATSNDVPERMDPENTWYIDINKPLAPQRENPLTSKPINVWKHSKYMAEMVLFEIDRRGNIRDLHVASNVGWGLTNPNFAMHHWNKWDGQADMNQGSGEIDMQGFDKDLKGYDEDYFNGGTLWSQWGGIIATAHPYIIQPGDYDSENGFLAHKTYSHNPNPKSPFDSWVKVDSRYLVENLPQFLDEPGEYYFDEDYGNDSGRLFLRLRKDKNPNRTTIEVSAAWRTLSIKNKEHIEISGLTFRFNGRKGNVIEILENSNDISIKNCKFEHIANDAIIAEVNANEEMHNLSVTDCDFHWINGGTSIGIQGHSGGGLNGANELGILNDVNVLRNRTRNTGLYRHNDHRWSNVPSIVSVYGRVMEIAGNITQNSLGSGLVVQGGKSGKDSKGWDIPLIRILVHHNKVEYAALGACDYGGMSLWQHGPMYSYNNISGNSVGHWPGGFEFRERDFVNLSYPLYLDGAFKIYNFNNITWSRPYDKDDPYMSTRASFFNVFGYLNPFVNNTVYGSGKGIGGTSGNRNDYLGNIFAEITEEFISVNHGGNPSLIGGDDPGTSGIDGAGTLAVGHNIFHGPATAGTVATVARGAKKDLKADKIPTLQQQMTDYPLIYGQLGEKIDNMPLQKPIPWEKEITGMDDADFRPKKNSPVIDQGVEYFIPWALYATVGEWYFNANHNNPEMILDYHHYPTKLYFHRSMYYRVPVFELIVNEATEADYVPSESENWVNGALNFDGTRYAVLTNERMTDDVLININEWRRKVFKLPDAPWIVPEPAGKDGNGKPVFEDDQVLVYPGSLRISPDMQNNNFLTEVILKPEEGHTSGAVLGKYDGNTGYRLFVNDEGYAEFEISSNGNSEQVVSKQKINDAQWHHILAEADRENGRLVIYIDGKLSATQKLNMDISQSLSNGADYIVGRSNSGSDYFRGAIDFMRISRGTLQDAETGIAELYEWQTNGPAYYDFVGNAPAGRRDVGAIERIK